jgi:chemosensory pili system protein ChpA (sensor histidine kinase/response regulator)
MQQITRAMAETVADLDNIENTMGNLTSESDTLLIQQGRVNTDLQEGLMRTRMVPFKTQLPRLRRIVRQTAKELKKKVNFELYGEEQEIDRRVLEKIMAPLEHLLRNAVSHGIETTQERKNSGKSSTGLLKLVVGKEGSEITLKVIDDGAGINIEAVRKKAIENGLMVESSSLTDNDIMQFILASGFSTASEVSQISGRGVGMDVVNSEIKQLNGTLVIESERGKGSVFDIHMPLTMSVSRALMVEVGEEIFAIPLVGIENIIRESHDVLEELTSTSNTYYQWHDEQYQFMHLGTALGINRPILPGEKNKAPILLARSGEHRVALFVDGLMGSREIVVKSVGRQLSAVKGVTGATILGDGKISLILDLGVLAREGAAMQTIAEQEIEIPTIETKVKTVMVVDDSITVRKVTERLLKRHEYHVITAKDGVDAIAVLHELIPDVMLLDVEMPRMDGFELATHMRDNDNFKDIPIIMITSRTGDKHRDRAMKIGVNEYMGKPYQEHDLVANIEKLTAD